MKLLTGLAFAAMAVSGAMVVQVEPQVSAPPDSSSLSAHETHAATSLLGQFRTNSASWLWLRTDLYLHNGVELRPMTEAEKRLGKHGAQPAPGEELHDESTMTTSVPPKDRDFRGWMGDVERATKAYQTMEGHKHNSPKDALPLFRLMTWVDPMFIQGWLVGSMVYAQGRTDKDTAAAIAFLREGIAANPNNPQLLADLGRVLVMRKNDRLSAVPMFRRATEQASRLKQLDEQDSEAVLAGFRMLAMCYRDWRRTEQCIDIAEAGLKHFPEDAVLARLAQPAPVIIKSVAAEEKELAKPKEAAFEPQAAVDGPGHEGHDHAHDH